MEGVARAAAEHDAAFLGTSTLRLAPLVKEQYLGFVDRQYPDLVERYERAYFGSNAPREYQRALDERVDRIRQRYGFVADSMRTGEITPPAHHPTTPSEAGLRRVGPQLMLPIVY